MLDRMKKVYVIMLFRQAHNLKELLREEKLEYEIRSKVKRIFLC